MIAPRSPGSPPLRPARVRGIVFDLDGTLVDSYPAIAASVNHARVAHGLPPLPEDEVRRHVGHGLESLVAELVGPAHVAESVRLFRERYAEVYAAGTAALDGAPQVVAELARRGYRLSVASNKPARFSVAILEALGMRDAFVTVQGPDLSGSTKPEPTMVRACLRAMEVEPSGALYVGDMVLDVESARRADIPVVLVPGGSSSRADLEATGELLLDGLDDLLRLLPEKASPPLGRPLPGRTA